MTRKLAVALVVGLLVGLLIGTLLPVQAGSRHADGRRLASLDRRVTRLESKAKHLNLKGELSPAALVSSCVSGAPAVWQAIDGTHTHIGC
jgi:hypothetical protein